MASSPTDRPASAGRENAGHGLRETLPALPLLAELLAARARQFVEAGPSVVLRGAPLRPDPTLRLQAIERGIERALVDLQDVLGELLNPLGDPPAVHGRREQGLQDKDIEGPLEEVGSGRHCVSFSSSTGVSASSC